MKYVYTFLGRPVHILLRLKEYMPLAVVRAHKHRCLHLKQLGWGIS